MLISCLECHLQVSDQASACPHCGYPLAPVSTKPRSRKKSNRRRRLPNGFGQISEIKNRNLRKPFRAMVTVGKDENGRPICKPLKPESYFSTYNDAYAALLEYNRNPYDLNGGMTVEELYNEWSPKYIATLKGASAGDAVKIAWRFCTSIYKMRVNELRARHIKGCMSEGTAFIRGETVTPRPYMQNRIKTLFNLMLDYAVEYDLVDKNYARTFELKKETLDDIEDVKYGHFPFTEEEMEILWNNLNKFPDISLILIQCYSGWRPQELVDIRIENVDIENWTFKSGLKTKAGMNRTVPIHSKIRSLVKERYEASKSVGCDWLFMDKKKKRNGLPQVTGLTYRRYLYIFSGIVREIGINPDHRPHDPRVHFVTQAKAANVDEYAIKHLVGHKITDITERVYTRRSMQWLRDELEKIQ